MNVNLVQWGVTETHIHSVDAADLHHSAPGMP